MSDLNKVIVIGRVVRDIELKHTPNGTAVASFSLANNKTYTSNGEKKEQVSFFECVAWSKSAEIISTYVKKGHRIGIEGRLQQRSWEDKDGNKRSTVEISVENFQFLEPRKDGDNSVSVQVQQEFGDNPFNDDDIAF